MELAGVADNETTITPWMLHLLQADIQLEILRTGYSPGTTDLVTKQYTRATGIPAAPSFNPAALGDTSLWNEVDPDTKVPLFSFSFQNAWGSKFQGKFHEPWSPNPPVEDWCDTVTGPLAHFRDFLQRRPLSSKLDTYMPSWDMMLTDS